MTISSDAVRKAGPYVGNSIVTVFVFAFKTFSASDLSVTLLTTATGVQQLLVLNTDYTVQLNANQDTNPGGTVTTIGAISPIPNTQTLTVSGNVMADTQGTDLITPGPWVPDDVEKMVDRAMIGVQQLRDRAIKFPVIDSVAPVDLPPAEQRKNATFIFDGNGQIAVGAVTTVAIPTTLGAIPFGTGAGIAVDATKLFWDNTNKRLGIGNAAPTVTLDVTGTGKFSVGVGFGNGNAGAPGAFFSAFPGTGFATGLHSSSLSFTVNGFGEAGWVNGSGQFISTINGTAAIPQWSYSADGGTGHFLAVFDVLGVAAGATKVATFTQTTVADATAAQTLALFGGGNNGFLSFNHYTQTAIGVAAKTIHVINQFFNMLLVQGTDGTNFFSEIITAIFGNAAVSAPFGVQTQGAPAARTYSISGSSNVQLSMAAGTYRTNVVSLQITSR